MSSVIRHRTAIRGLASLAVAALLAACSSAAAPSAPQASPTPEPATVTPSPVPSVTAAPSSAPATEPPSPRPRPSLDVDLDEIAAYLTSSITLLDLTAEDLTVVVAYVDPASGESFPLGEYPLQAMDQSTNAVPPGTYQLTFLQPPGSSAGPVCTVEVSDTDGYVFAVIDGDVAVIRTGTPPTDAAELFVATSSLCQR